MNVEKRGFAPGDLCWMMWNDVDYMLWVEPNAEKMSRMLPGKSIVMVIVLVNHDAGRLALVNGGGNMGWLHTYNLVKVKS